MLSRRNSNQIEKRNAGILWDSNGWEMIEININPIALTAGSFKIWWGIVMGIVAAIVALPVFAAYSKKIWTPKGSYFFWLGFLTVTCGYIGAILFYIIENLIVYHAAVNIFRFRLTCRRLSYSSHYIDIDLCQGYETPLLAIMDIGLPCLIYLWLCTDWMCASRLLLRSSLRSTLGSYI